AELMDYPVFPPAPEKDARSGVWARWQLLLGEYHKYLLSHWRLRLLGPLPINAPESSGPIMIARFPPISSPSCRATGIRHGRRDCFLRAPCCSRCGFGG